MNRIATLLLTLLTLIPLSAAKKDIYKKGWIDFNKNGRMDIYEDPSASIDARVKDLLSQMTLEEKTCQLATLYGSGRVLRDTAPTAAWKQAVWKDGIANIDEQANGIGPLKSELSFPYVTACATGRPSNGGSSRRHGWASPWTSPTRVSGA